MTVDILYLASNRKEFTEITLSCLIQNTDWSLVDKLILVDDDSNDGTHELLASISGPSRAVFKPGIYGSPVRVMQQFLECWSPNKWFVKLDNDIAVPPGWLQALLEVREEYPRVDLVGIEAGMTSVPGRDKEWDGRYWLRQCTHIGGIGLMRTAAFARRPPLRANSRYFGFTEWQHNHPDVMRGWIEPDLRAPLLDRMPMEPFKSLNAEYEAKDWQRHWGVYEDATWMYEWLLDDIGYACEKGVL